MPCSPAAASALCGSVSSRATEPWDGGSLTRACMRRCGCVGRGNHLTLIAAANCYQRPIRVWATAPGDDWWLQIEPKHYKVSTLLALRLVLQSRMVCGMVASGHGAPTFDCGRARRGGSLPVRCPLVNALHLVRSSGRPRHTTSDPSSWRTCTSGTTYRSRNARAHGP